MKRIICVLIAVLLCVANLCGIAEKELTPQEKAFEAAKQALVLLSQNKLADAISALGLEDVITKDELDKLISENAAQLKKLEPQTEYAVYWQTKETSYLAVPFEDPTDGFVDAVVYELDSEYAFKAIFFAKWTDVTNSYENGKNVVWNIEYTADYIVIQD